MNVMVIKNLLINISTALTINTIYLYIRKIIKERTGTRRKYGI
jgi:hypothetical protein